jgi:serine/threonine protein kinase
VTAGTCPDATEILAFIEGTTCGERRDRILEHLDGCPDCRRVLGAVAGASAVAPVATAPRPGTPTGIGRYRITGILGRGGMGVVYRAWDPELAREVALKVARTSVARQSTDRGRNEARAAARVAHPNVVAVYDVGTGALGNYVAFEIVEGRDLRQWLRDRPSQTEILSTFVAAARGLAAVHGEGLVHRDFKPDNVLVDARGRVKLADFGLASTMARVDADHPTLDDTRRDLLETNLTETGTVLGTPAYMAPEQFAGGDVDGRTDQFAFCVALFEALVGHRPFAGRTLEALRANVLGGRRLRPPRSAMPRRVAAILDRGLQREPGDRFASMDEVCRALEAGTRRSIAPRLGLAVALAGGAMALPLEHSAANADVERAPDRGSTPDAEAGASPSLRSPAAREKVALAREAIRASAHESASAELEAAYALAAASGDERAARVAAIALVGHLGSRLGRDQDAAWWARHAEILVEGHPRDQARLATAQARAALARDDFDAARTHADRAVALLADGSPDATLIELTRHLGHFACDRGDTTECMLQMRRAVSLAEALHGPEDPDVADDHANLGIALYRVGEVDEAQHELRVALRIFARTLGPGDPRNGTAHTGLGLVLLERGDPEGASTHLEFARTLEVARFGPHHPHVGAIVNNLALADVERTGFEAALARHDEAVAIFSVLEPPRPSGLAQAHRQRAMTALHAGRVERAADDAHRALQIAETGVPEALLARLAETACVTSLAAERADADVPCERFTALPSRGGVFAERRALATALAKLHGGDLAAAREHTLRFLETEDAEGSRDELLVATMLAEALHHAELHDLAAAVGARTRRAYVREVPGDSPLGVHLAALRRRLDAVAPRGKPPT